MLQVIEHRRAVTVVHEQRQHDWAALIQLTDVEDLRTANGARRMAAGGALAGARGDVGIAGQRAGRQRQRERGELRAGRDPGRPVGRSQQCVGGDQDDQHQADQADVASITGSRRRRRAQIGSWRARPRRRRSTSKRNPIRLKRTGFHKM